MSGGLELQRKGRRAGNALIEFTLVGIPILFILISIFEIARGMWLYTTLQHAVKDTVRFAIVHGQNCGVNGNSCAITLSQIGTRFREQAPMFEPADVQLELRAGCGSGEAYSAGCAAVRTTTLQSVLADNTTVWPDGAGEGSPGVHSIEIYASTPFDSIIQHFSPGTGVGQRFGTFNLQAIAREMVQF